MRRLSILAMVMFMAIASSNASETALQKRLYETGKITSIKPLENTADFTEKYVTMFTQPLDHSARDKGMFSQRVVVMHRGFDRPTVIVTEGYGADYALSPGYREELSRLFDMNIVFAEHRFFGASVPTPCNWTYMTDRNAMGDLHEVVTALKAIYPGKWVSTGISKGGQTCMEFRAFYPEDVDVSVPYVGPLCFGVEDGRHEPFLRQVGTAQDRQRIQDFQIEVLKRKNRLMPAFQAHCLKQNLRFNIPVRDVFDYCVLEYSFAHWQWGTPTTSIPSNDSRDEVMLHELLRVAGPDYFSPKGNTPFFYQAAYELGYYGYDLKPFKKFTSVRSTKNYLRRVMLPDSLSHVKFHRQLSRFVKKWLKKNDPQMIILYGEIDPWTAAGVTWLNTQEKQNMHLFIQPEGSHLTRIGNMPENLKQQILELLTRWLGEPPVSQKKKQAA